MSLFGQVGHLLRKDLRRFWPLMVGLGVLIMIPIFGGPAYEYETWGWFRSPLSEIPGDAMGVILALFGALVIQEDPLVGEQIPWLSRPVSPVALFLEKTLLVGGACVVAPALLQGWALQGYGPTVSPLHLILDSVVRQGFIVALVAVGAAVSPNLKSFLAIGVLFLGGMGIFFTLFQGPQLGGGWDQGVSITRTFVTNIWWLLAGPALVIHQLLTRRTRQTIALATLAFLAPHLLGDLWQWDWSISPYGPERSYKEAPAVEMSLESLVLEPYGANGVPRGEEGVRSNLSISGPPGLMAVVTGVSSRITGSGVDRAGPAIFLRSSPSMEIASRSLMGLEWIGDKPYAHATHASATLLTDHREEMDRIRANVQTVEITASIQAFHPMILGRLPLREGASIQTDQGVFRVEQLTLGGQSLSVDVSRVHVRSTLEARFYQWSASNQWGLALANKNKGEIFPSREAGGHGSGSSFLILGPLVTRFTREAVFNAGTVDWGEGGAGFDADWMEGAELIVVGAEYMGSFEETMRANDVDLPENFGEPTRVGRSGGPGTPNG